jgi:acyl-CoA-binding protein
MTRKENDMDLKASFEDTQKRVKTLKKAPSPDVLLKLYSHFKQGNEGDVKGKRPGLLDIKGRAKFDAWNGLEGMSKDAAMEAYVKLVDSLVG